MKLVRDRKATLAAFDRFRRARCAFFAPNAEQTTEIEGLLIGCQEFAEEHGIAELPVGIGMTGVYPDNAQFRKISTSCVLDPDTCALQGGDVRQGCEIWLRLLEVYEDLDGSFPAVRLLPFIDHGWSTDEQDRAILFDESVVERMAVIMYDASTLDYEENIGACAAYVERFGDRVVVEAAADKIYAPKDIVRLKLTREDQLSKPEDVIRFVEKSGVDLVVPNIGTEHRSVGAGTADRRYERALAQAIRDGIGPIMALHGSSSLGGKVGETAEDGIIKVNFYTAMAVGGGQKLYRRLKALERRVLEENDLAINSISYSHDLRRRHVAEVTRTMLATLHYDRLQEA